MPLTIVPVTAENEEAWRTIHNVVIPASPLSVDEVRQRRFRHVLTLAHAGDDLVGNATIRPPEGESGAATVIVRILPEFRRRGYGSEYLAETLRHARTLGGPRIETVVLTANADGLRFAQRHGFVEVERYTVDGAEYADFVLGDHDQG